MAMGKNKRHGHYCKICGEYRANEKFTGKGHAAHICKACAKLSPADQAEQMTIQRLYRLPERLSKEQLNWLKNRTHDKRPNVREMAQEIYEIRFMRPVFSDLPEVEIGLTDLDEFEPGEPDLDDLVEENEEDIELPF